MGVSATRYITLSNRGAGYNDDDNFIEPHVIGMMVFDELKLPRIEEFVNGANITITEDEIKDFLDKKMDEGNPDSLQYFKAYTSILKEKCKTLLSVLNDINNCKSETLSEEAKQRLLDLDFHINSKGNIYFQDAERLADAIIYNVKDLREKIQAGNNPETYLTFRESKPRLTYPSRKIQIKDRHHAFMPEFIALSSAQQTQVQKEVLECFYHVLIKDFAEDYEIKKGAILQKK